MKSLKYWAALVFILVGSGVIYANVLSNGPDFDVSFVRDVPTKLNPEYLDKVLRDIPRWPDWFFFGAKAGQIDFRGEFFPIQDQKLVEGSTIEMYFDPHKRPHDQFTLRYQVLQYIPKKLVKLRVIFDSKEALTKLFDPLDWTIEILPNPRGGTMLRGIETGHTRHWRARLFGKLFPSIFLNQIFYPNLLVLSEINNPETVHPFPQEN